MTLPRSAAVLAVLVAGLAGCSDDGDDPEAGTEADLTDAEQVCSDWAAVQVAATAVADVDVVADGTDALRASLEDLRGTLDDLQGSAGSHANDELVALGDAVRELGTVLRAVASGGAGDEAGTGMVAVGQAVGNVADAADTLGDELRPECAT